MANSPVDDAITDLKQRKRSMRCRELVSMLEELGFDVRDGARGGHKVYTHPHLKEFLSDSINCDHGKNPQVKPAYVAKVIRNLEQHQAELEEFLETNHD